MGPASERENLFRETMTAHAHTHTRKQAQTRTHNASAPRVLLRARAASFVRGNALHKLAAVGEEHTHTHAHATEQKNARTHACGQRMPACLRACDSIKMPGTRQLMIVYFCLRNDAAAAAAAV